jgi:hypothetical protein
MTYIDPVVNASKVDLLAGKAGGLFARWDNKPIPPRGKRAVASYSDAHRSCNDIFCSPFNEGERVSCFRPISSLSETLFHRGFHRRLFPKQDENRFAIENRAFERFNERTADAINAYERTRRNILTGEGLQPSHLPKKIDGTNVSPIFDLERAKESYKRNINNGGRFFMERPGRSFSASPCETVLIGVTGSRKRNRATSVGIFDNFTHTQYKLDVPLPRPSRRNISQITLL